MCSDQLLGQRVRVPLKLLMLKNNGRKINMSRILAKNPISPSTADNLPHHQYRQF